MNDFPAEEEYSGKIGKIKRFEISLILMKIYIKSLFIQKEGNS